MYGDPCRDATRQVQGTKTPECRQGCNDLTGRVFVEVNESLGEVCLSQCEPVTTKQHTPRKGPERSAIHLNTMIDDFIVSVAQLQRAVCGAQSRIVYLNLGRMRIFRSV